MFAASKSGSPPTAANYIEDVFSTWVYAGNGSTVSVNNGIDLSTKGGLVWFKDRTSAFDNRLFDTARGATQSLSSNLTTAQTTGAGTITFNSNGFATPSNEATSSRSGENYASWTFRKQAKFFDVVTYTGNGVNNRKISHSLGSTPGCIIIKRTSGTEAGGIAGYWIVYHRGISTPQSNCLFLNTTDAVNGTSVWNNTAPTSTEFTLGTSYVNYSGDTYVAYLFAHDAGGFGASGTDNVISCGSTNGTKVTLGWEPQWILYKSSNFVEDWQVVDNMRGLPVGATAQLLRPNTSGAEGTTSNNITIAADGFTLGAISGTAIYIAIRRGPMRTPTSGTSVFNPTLSSAGTGTKITTNFPVDLQWWARTAGLSTSPRLFDRLRGVNTTTTASVGPYLKSSSTDAEVSDTSGTRYWDNTGFQIPGTNGTFSTIYWNFGRAPGFFDEVCYDGNNANRTINHNLGVAPELMIAKQKSVSGTSIWMVYAGDATKYLRLNDTTAATTLSTVWNNTAPTSTVFSLGTNGEVNVSGRSYVWYGFASVAGVSKVGSYTGNGSSQTINCGFTAGARFVLIKRTDSTGAWYVWDTARGMVAGNDPWIAVNTINAETTTDDSVDTDNSGFIVNQVAATNVNVNAATYIFLAIA